MCINISIYRVYPTLALGVCVYGAHRRRPRRHAHDALGGTDGPAVGMPVGVSEGTKDTSSCTLNVVVSLSYCTTMLVNVAAVPLSTVACTKLSAPVVEFTVS